jgi:MraZ protein
LLQKGFLGTYDATIDDKGRVRLPAKFRALLGDNFIVSQGTDSCLCVYPEETWQALTGDVTKLGTLDMDVINFRRSLFANSVEGDFDAAGRVLLPIRQRKYANLTKELVVIGNFDYFEIWDSETWNNRDYSSAEARKALQAKVSNKED